MNRDSANYVHAYYSVEKYISTYAIGLEPTNGPNMWPKAAGNLIKPPNFTKMPGRPKIRRKRDADEEPKNLTKLPRNGLQITCQVCFKVGHNKRTCKEKNNPGFKRPKKLPVSISIA